MFTCGIVCQPEILSIKVGSVCRKLSASCCRSQYVAAMCTELTFHSEKGLSWKDLLEIAFRARRVGPNRCEHQDHCPIRTTYRKAKRAARSELRRASVDLSNMNVGARKPVRSPSPDAYMASDIRPSPASFSSVTMPLPGCTSSQVSLSYSSEIDLRVASTDSAQRL